MQLNSLDSPNELNVAVAELAQVYHGVCHHHSYISIDCGVKLNCKLYSEISIAKKVKCEKTKAESLVENILAPQSLELVLKEISVTNGSQLFFSIATDASNKGIANYFRLL